MRLFFLLGFLAFFVFGCTQIYVPQDRPLVFEEIKKPIPARKGFTIVLDAGHGGKDFGASKSNAYEEKKLTLSTTHLVHDYLTKLGYKVVMTRSQDLFVSLPERAEIANALRADLFVSIHYNYSANPEAKGIEVYYYKDEKDTKIARLANSRTLAQKVLARVVERTGAESRGIKTANFAVIRETRMPAILIEAGFLSNPAERTKICDLKYQRHIAWGIAKGIDEHLIKSERPRRESNARPAA